MIHLLILAVHLLSTIAKLARPGGVHDVVAESLMLKHQLLISSRSLRRAPNLNSFDRFILALGSLFVSPSRIPKLAVILKPRTLLRFHEALKKCKYRWLFSSGGHRRPGPKGLSKELIDAIVEFKRRNPRVGCPRIALEIAHAFGIDIDKDIVRRVLAKHYRPGAGTDLSRKTYMPRGSCDLRQWPNAFQPRAKRIARHRQVVSRLQIEPIFWRLGQHLAESQRQVGGDRSGAGNDMRYPHCRHADRARKLGLRNTDLAQDFAEEFAWMNCRQLVVHVL